jgi:ABC-2 type transport system permease protein
MNPTIVRLTQRSLLGRRRALLLLALPFILIVLAGVVRAIQGSDPDHSVSLLGGFGLSFLVPLLCLIAGTGAIGPEIDDGSIIYLLAKPLSRYTIVVSKLVTAIAVVTAFGALSILVSGVITAGGSDRLAIGYALGALVAGIAYCALFLLLAIVSRNAVVIGLIYALIWEGVVGSFVQGAQTLSIQQWALAITEKVVGARADELGVTSAVDLPTAIVLLLVLTVGATAYAGYRLRSLRITTDE